MSEYVTIFINDNEIKIDKSADNFKNLFGISEKMFSEYLEIVMNGVARDKTPGDGILDFLERGKFDFLLYLAGRGLIDLVSDVTKNAHVIRLD